MGPKKSSVVRPAKFDVIYAGPPLSWGLPHEDLQFQGVIEFYPKPHIALEHHIVDAGVNRRYRIGIGDNADGGVQLDNQVPVNSGGAVIKGKAIRSYQGIVVRYIVVQIHQPLIVKSLHDFGNGEIIGFIGSSGLIFNKLIVFQRRIRTVQLPV